MSIDSLEVPEINPGIKLPKSNEEWNTANAYFKSIFLNIKIQPNSLDSTIKYVSDSIYNYFKATCGTVNSVNQSNEFYSKYKDLTAKVLKQKLRKLKYHNDPLPEIKYVSRLLRSSLKSKQTSSNSSVNMGNQDNYIRKNFWGFVKNVLERGSSVLRSYTPDHCKNCFIKIFSTVRPLQIISIPSWIPKFSESSTPFDLSPPTYQKFPHIYYH